MSRPLIKPATLGQITGYRCCFFDFDGVVLESANIKTEAFIELYHGSGFEKEIRDHHLSNQGISRFEKFKWISENLFNEKYDEEKGTLLGTRFSELVKAKVLSASYVRGVQELITEINRVGIYTVIASGTPEEELKEIVRERGLESSFDEVHGSPKTKRDIVKGVIDKKGFNTSECIFFGDASTDHKAAVSSGVDFYARITSELLEYWNSVGYTYGTPDFSIFQRAK